MKKFFILFLILACSHAKFASCYPDFTGRDNWAFCTKMAFGLHKEAEVTNLNYFVTGYATDQSDFSSLELLVLNDDNWSKVHEIGHDKATCAQVHELAFESVIVPKEGNDIELWVNRLIEFKSQVWFFVLADCA